MNKNHKTNGIRYKNRRPFEISIPVADYVMKPLN